jgi:CTP synthase (UTP-ammonia lyase)
MTPTVRIAVIGDFNPEYHTHHAINASLTHAAGSLGLALDCEWLATEHTSRDAASILRHYHGLFIASGSPYRSMYGAFEAIRFARTEQWPLLGT